MEYRNIYFSIFGIVGLCLWAISFWNIGKRPVLYLPKSLIKKSYLLPLLRMFLFTLGIIAWLLISYSLTGPRKIDKYIKGENEIHDIFFVLDVSRSMLANDFNPNRLEVAKQKILDFIKLRPKDRIGIVIFAEKVFTQLPLTTDLKLIEQVVKDINVGFLGSGTNIGDAIGLTVGRIKSSEAISKVMILLTDGVNNVDSIPPLEAAKMAAREKIKVYSIGIGSDPKAKIPGPGGRGRFNIPGGSIDIKNLQEISSITNAKNYIAKDERSLSDIMSQIDKMERTKITASTKIVYNELFYNYLLAGVLLFIMLEIIRRLLLREVT